MSVLVRSSVRRAILASAIVALLCTIAAAQQSPPQNPYRIAYQLGMSHPASHLFEVQIGIETGAPTDFVDLQMPKWSPGRYAIFDFAKNVQEVSAVSGICPAGGKCDLAARPVTRMDDQTWRVGTLGSTSLTVTYKVFGDDLSGTFSQLDTRHADYNGGSVFMYIAGHKQDPVTLHIDPPPSWRIVNGRMDSPDQREWQFPNYDLLIDTPTEIGPDWTMDQFRVDGKLYRVVVHSFGNEGGRRAALVRDLERIVRAETAMWGPPEFDSYTFLIHFAADGHSGDGMEHLTSTQIIEPGVLADSGMYGDTLDAAAHEFFHVWNVKRLRPVELGPWDFTRPVSTRALWIAEGLTNYYGHLMQRRAGLWTDEKLLSVLGEYISEVENAPGSRLMSADESSVIAPLIDGAPRAQHTNLANTSVSYYPKGEVLGIVLDLLIRGKTHGRASLDDVLRRMYEEFYVKSPPATYYLRGRGYTDEDFARVASAVARIDLGDFFTRYVRGHETPPYEEALAQAGLRLVREPAREPYTAGITITREDLQSARIASVQNGSAAERAGLKQDDVLVSIGKAYVTTLTWRSALNVFKKGDRVPVTIRRDRRTIQTSLTLDGPGPYDYRIEEVKNSSPEARAIRAAWLKGKG